MGRLLLFAAVLTGLTPAAAAASDLAVRCGRLIDGLGPQPRAGVTVLIRDGRVAAVGAGFKPPPGTPVLDLSSFTVLPGLIDAHTHLLDDPSLSADPSRLAERTLADALAVGRKSALATLRAGFTTVREAGTYIAWSDRALRAEIEAGKTPGPRMLVAGFYLTAPGGGGDVVIPGTAPERLPAFLRQGVARGPEAFRSKAELAVRGGADVVKVIASGAVLVHGGQPGEPEMTFAELSAAAEAAHRAGRRLAAHAHGARSIKEALRAGADTVEHASYLDEEGILLAKERGAALVMDVYNGDYIDSEGRRNGMPAGFLEKNRAALHRQREAFARAHRAGVTLVFGTDAGVFPHGDNARQFRVMAALGMTPLEAIRSATSAAARALGWEDEVGAVVPGRYGDLIAVRGDPLLDVTLLEDVAVVVKGGVVVKAP